MYLHLRGNNYFIRHYISVFLNGWRVKVKAIGRHYHKVDSTQLTLWRIEVLIGYDVTNMS